MGKLMYVRASLGTLIALGLERGRADVLPSIAYVMQYSEKGCMGKCAFCAQSIHSKAPKDLLSRVIWPKVDLSALLTALARSRYRRVCLQTVIKEGFIDEVHYLVRNFSELGLGISLSITPIPKGELEALAREGVDYLGVGLDAASKNLVEAYERPFTWEAYWNFIKAGVEVLGKRKVVTHIIVGLGESLEDILNTIEELRNVGSDVSLFAFTPLKGTRLSNLSPPSLRYYRLVQLATKLIMDGYSWRDFIVYRNGEPYIKKSIVGLDADELLDAVIIRGCPGCNRPFYNEVPGREPYNFPDSEVLSKWRGNVIREINEILV
ncbi:MAG: radical SAM protein [Desulfurococcales archaeon]|nr:radical SAM protein [Desulfurococcales archaeon]